jgi:2-oxoacid:acceptor oxidoreductase gamma subunit (pyruvate/2-ketoisovalerate family)/2-oxoacid:acceptor oxidoreductase delta subunit (pyruvate/2-ketoisovalerate family)
MLEVRGHARGGQGMVTAFEILAKVFSRLDQFNVQAFPAFGVERTGAPIQAFLRVAREAILNRSNVYSPHLIVVFDESLLEQVPVLEGIKPGGALLINTESPASAFAESGAQVFTVPATRISLDLGLGSKALPIVNAAMIGAVMRLTGGDLTIALDAIRDNVPGKPEANAAAAAAAYEALQGPAMPDAFLMKMLHEKQSAEQAPAQPANGAYPTYAGLDAPAWDQPMSKNKTGNWRLNTPAYLSKRPPCNSNCPAGTDVREFVKLASEQRFQEALDVIYTHNPFPSVCGRVCPHFCEQHCNRNELDGGVNIGAIERFLGDLPRDVPLVRPIRFEDRIAVIGSGPAGLTAALRLRELGYAVTVYEAMPQAGGMMRAGIPKFRLPDAALDREIERIRQAGVEIVLNRKVSVPELAGEFQAVIVAAGAHLGAAMHIENEALALEGLTFLRNFKLQGERCGIQPGDDIAVIGGGNTAIDVARTALRLGARPTVYYRRTGKEMPAIAQEVQEALAEGVGFEFLIAPLALRKAADGKTLLSLTRMELGDPDQSGRRRPVPVAGSEFSIQTDKVIAAIGQYTDRTAFGEATSKAAQGRMEGFGDMAVFGAGDMAWGGTVAEAIGSGNEAAQEVYAFLRKQTYRPPQHENATVLPGMMNYNYYMTSVRHEGVERHPHSLTGDFAEVNTGITEADLTAEAARCLHCGDCFRCGNCMNYCPDAAIHMDEDGRLRIDYDYCKGCGICVQECPCSAIDFEALMQAQV